MRKMIQGLAAVLLFGLFFCPVGCSRRANVYTAGLETERVQEMQNADETVVSEANASDNASQEPAGYVFVCGAVTAPGVYPFHEGMRIFEAVELAGGFAAGADEDWLNQAQTLADGQRLYVYTKKETQELKEAQASGEISGAAGNSAGQLQTFGVTGDDAGETPAAAGGDASGKVNINTADMTELMTLPGIGEVKAQAIVEYREAHGGFSSTEELKEIPGIKQAVFSKIEDQITV